MSTLWRALVLAMLVVPAPAASAASLYLHIPGINGQQSTPGYPNAMSIHSLTIAPAQFGMVRPLDAASPAIQLAGAQGTPLSAFALVYDGVPVGGPDASLAFPSALVSSYQIAANLTDEEVSFAATNPGSIFLEIPGIVGASSTPGHPNVMQVQSFTLTANDFRVEKAIDSASPQIAQAVLQGTIFAQARVLFYNAAVPVGAPDAVWGFQTILGSAYQPLQNGERDTFTFAHVPEPASSATMIVGVAITLFRRRIPATC